MPAIDLLERIVSRFPEFAAQWNASDNLYRDDDGTFTECGVFSEFSAYFRDSYLSHSADDLQHLAMWIEQYLADEALPESDAVATCFLENLSGEPAIERIKPFLGVRARSYLAGSSAA